MSGHEFERQVRQKLNDLKMTPSADAWDNIEQNLREKRRRVAPVFWLSLLLVGLAAGGYMLFNPITNAPHASVAQQEKTVAPQSSVNPQEKTVAPQSSVGSQDKTVAPQSSVGSQEKTVAPEASRISAPQVSTSAPKASSKKDVAASGVVDEPSAKLSIQQSTSTNPFVVAPHAKDQIAQASSEKLLSAYNKIPALTNANQKSIINAPSLPINTGNASKPAMQKKKSSKWSYGLSGVAGVSSVSEGDFFNLNFNKSEVEDVAMVAAFAPQPHRPSAITSGFTYSLGGFVMRELSNKFSLSAGINYLQLNTRNKVGSRINARQIVNNGSRGYLNVTSYYTLQQDQPSEYRNRYHFIEVPVELHTRLNKSKKVQLFLNTGMAVSQLLKSNSLHFDGSSGVYYKNDKLLNQTQVAAKAGFSFGLLYNTTRPIWIGPYARYNISRILQKDVSASKSFASFGVDVKLFIK